MRLCRCDMCEALGDIPPAASAYQPPPSAPNGWAHVSIVRMRSVDSPEPRGQRMTFLSLEMGQVEASLVPTGGAVRPEPVVFHVATELDLCPKCIEKLVGHPGLTKRIAADDMRAEATALRGMP